MAYDVLSNEKLLTKVKSELGITGDYQNDTLNIYIDEVKHFMMIAGVSNIFFDYLFIVTMNILPKSQSVFFSWEL